MAEPQDPEADDGSVAREAPTDASASAGAAPEAAGQIPLRPTLPDPFDLTPRWRVALLVALAAFAVETVIVFLWTLRLFVAPADPGWVVTVGLIVVTIALLAGGIASAVLPWLRGFVPLVQCLIFGGFGAAFQVLILLGLSMRDAFAYTTGWADAPQTFGYTLLMIVMMWFYTALPGFLTGVIAWGLARVGARGRVGLVVLCATGAAALLVWGVVGVASALQQPQGPQQFMDWGEELSPGETPLPGLPDGCSTDGSGPKLPPDRCPDPRDGGAPT